MRDDVAVTTILDFLRTLTELPVVLASQESEVTVPGVILEDIQVTTRPEMHGVKSFAGESVNEFGTATGSEHHFYREFLADLVVRSEDLGEAYDTHAAFFSGFIPHVDDPRSLHEDYCQMELGAATPRSVPFREPDWYEVGRPLSFVYILREIVDGDSLEAIETVVDPDFTLEFTL